MFVNPYLNGQYGKKTETTNILVGTVPVRACRSVADRFLRKEEAPGSNPGKSTLSIYFTWVRGKLVTFDTEICIYCTEYGFNNSSAERSNDQQASLFGKSDS